VNFVTIRELYTDAGALKSLKRFISAVVALLNDADAADDGDDEDGDDEYDDGEDRRLPRCRSGWPKWNIFEPKNSIFRQNLPKIS
jgi:hypothetical protein